MQGAIFIPILKKDGEIVSNGRTHTTKFGANTSNFKQGMNEMVKELENYNKALVDNQYRQKDCNKTITDAQKQIRQIQKDIKEKGSADEEQTKKLKELNETIEAEKVKLSQLKTEQASIKGTISSLSKEIAGNNKEWTTLKATMANLAADGVEALSKKLLEIGKNVISVGKEFTSSMSEVGAISGATAEELELLEQTAREYGSTTKFSASEAAQALKYMALAGWDVQTSIAALPGVLNLAAASGMDLATASDMVTDYLSAFGMEAQQAAYMADLMTYAQSNSNTSAQQLGAAWGNCAANMNAAGQDIETTTSFLEAMANQGLKSAEAGTAMAAIMRDITDKMEDGKIAIGNTNVAVADSEGNFRDLTDIMKDVEKAVDGMGTAESSAALSATFTARSLKGVNLILNEGVDTISGYEEALRNSTGSASDAAKTMSNNLSGDIKTMQSAFEELALKIYDDGETPIRSLVQTITKFGVPAIEGIVKSMDKIAPIIIAAATAMGSYKASLSIQPLVQGLVSAFTAKTAATAADTVATEAADVATKELNITMAANPLMAVVSLVLALTAAIGSYIAMSKTATGTTDDLNKSTTDYLQNLHNAEQAALEQSQQTEAEILTLGTLKDRYDELRKKVSLTTAEKQELESVAKELSGTLGTTTDELKEKDGTYKDLTSDVNDYIEKLKEEIKFESAKEGLTAAYKDYNAAVEQYRSAGQKVAEINKKMSETGFKAEMDKLNESFKNSGMSIDDYNAKQVELYKKLGYTQEEISAISDEYTDSHTAVSFAAEAVAKHEKALGSATDEGELYDNLMKEAANSTGKLADSTDDLSGKTSTLTTTTKKAAQSEKTYAERISEATKEVDTAKQALKSLEDNYNSLQNKQQLSLNTLIDLAAKYPEYSSEILSANGNIEKQKTVLEKLFEVQKAEYILKLEKSKKEIEASNEATETQLKNAKKQIASVLQIAAALGAPTSMIEEAFKAVNKQLEEFNKQLDGGKNKVKVLDDTIATVKKLKPGDYTSGSNGSSGGSSSSGSGSSVSGGNSSNTSKTYYAKVKFGGKDSGEKGTGSTQTEANLDLLDRLESMDKVTLKQEKSMLKQWLANENLTYEERYKLRLKLKNVEDKLDEEKDKKEEEKTKKEEQRNNDRYNNYLKTIDNKKALDQLSLKSEIASYNYMLKYFKLTEDQKTEILKRRYNAENQLRQKNQELAKAAYEKLVNDEISSLEKENEAIQKNADKRIKAIDDEINKRKQQNDDDSRQKELDSINAQLRYAQLDSVTRMELERRKQDILNEQAEIDWEREQEAKKTQIQEKADQRVAANTKAIENLSNVLEKFGNALAKMYGTQTTQQIVNNNSKSANINLVKNGMTDQQLLKKFLKVFYN